MGKCFPETSRWSQAEADVTAMNRDNWVNREELRAYVELAEAFFKRNKRDSKPSRGERRGGNRPNSGSRKRLADDLLSAAKRVRVVFTPLAAMIA
jgi:hypothetical protein